MKSLILSLLISIFAYPTVVPISGPEKEIIYVGTYNQRESQGLYVYEYDRKNHTFTQTQTVPELVSPSFLEVHPTKKHLYTISQSAETKKGLVSSFSIHPKNGQLTLVNQMPIAGNGSCHIHLDKTGKWIFVSNYGSGSMEVFAINKDGSVGKSTQNFTYTGSSVNQDRQKSPHVHSVNVSPDNKHVYVADLGTDKLMIYNFDAKTGKLSPASTPSASSQPGDGPRHFTFHPTKNWVFVAEEIESAASVWSRNAITGALTKIQRISTLPDGFSDFNKNADIHTDPAGKHLYVSNRGHESLVIYSIDQKTGKLSTIGYESTFGEHPRNFMMDDMGEFVLVANRDTDNVTYYLRDDEQGTLSYSGISLNIPAPVCVKQLHFSVE